jgi:hypothetical protein
MNRSLPLVALLGVAACASATSSPTASPIATASSGPDWYRAGDQSTGEGNVFVCQGEGITEEAALAAAHGICNDKACKLCGIEVESVVQTTETLKGVEMKRKVVERCRRFRKGEPKVVHKSSDCGRSGCVTWLAVELGKEDEKRECAVYASEHFADPAECQRLIESFRNTRGRTAESFRVRTRLLDEALAACKDIDVRPTPLVDALHAQLFAGMDVFEFTPGRQQGRLEEPFFDSTWYHSRDEMMRDRGVEDWYLTTYAPLRQQIKETPSLAGRIQLVRDYVHNRSLVFDVIEALHAEDRDAPAGTARILAALRAAPLGGQYGSTDVHLGAIHSLRDLRGDIAKLTGFYRDAYRPEDLYWNHGIPLAALFAKDRRIEEAEWQYIFRLHQSHPCPVCMGYLVEAPDHGGLQVRDQRFFAWLDYDLGRAKRPDDRKRIVTQTMPHDPDYLLHVHARLPADLRALLDWDFYRGRLDEAADRDVLPAAREMLSLLGKFLTATPATAVTPQYCGSLADRLNYGLKRGGAFPPIDAQICACLTGPFAGEGSRVLVNKSELYNHALARSLPCVEPK